MTLFIAQNSNKLKPNDFSKNDCELLQASGRERLHPLVKLVDTTDVRTDNYLWSHLGSLIQVFWDSLADVRRNKSEALKYLWE